MTLKPGSHLTPAYYMLLSALGFSLMSLFVKLSAQEGIPVMQVLAARALVSLVLSYVALKAAHICVLGKNRKLLCARGFIGFLALSMVYYSMTHLPLAVATVIQFLNPLFTAILGLFLLKEAIGKPLIYCTLCSIAGVVIMVLPYEMLFNSALTNSALTNSALTNSALTNSALTNSMQTNKLTETLISQELSVFALFVGLGGAMLSALAYVIVRRLGPTEHPLVIVFYFPLIALPASVPFFYQDFVMPSLLSLSYLILVGCFTQIGQIYLTKAMALESAGKNTAYAYTQVIFATTWGLLFLGEIPTIATIIGAGMIMLGAYFNIAFKTRAE